MNDNYTHLDNRLMYVVENIPGPAEETEEYIELLSNFNSQLSSYCQCRDKCEQDTCSCLQRSGGPNYISYNDSPLAFKLSDKDFKTYTLIECNSLCSCSDYCGNRLIQKGPIKDLVVKTLVGKGMGLFTKNPIPRGAFICEYAGEVITKSQALKRHEANLLEGKMNYIYCLNEYCSDRVTQTFIDPSYFGNIGRYLNHSCEPNCYILPARVDLPIPKLAIFSSSNISPDMELTFDYGSHSFGNSSDENKGIIDVAKSSKKCLCNTYKCKGFMPYEVY